MTATMNRQNGAMINTLPESLAQCVNDLITTPIGSRIMRRDYGCLLPELIDAPADGALIMQLRAAIAHAILKYEPRLKFDALQLTRNMDSGAFSLTIIYKSADPISLTLTRGAA